MRVLRPPVVILMVGTAVVALLIVGTILPLVSSIASQRADITQQREQIAQLQAQQRNIAMVTKEYDALQEKETTIGAQFLQESGSVDFFNAIDELIAASGATNSQLRIDTPVRTQRYQQLGIHLTFNASYRSVVTFLRGVHNLQELVTVSNVSISNGNDAASNLVTIDAQVPWSQAL